MKSNAQKYSTALNDREKREKILRKFSDQKYLLNPIDIKISIKNYKNLHTNSKLQGEGKEPAIFSIKIDIQRPIIFMINAEQKDYFIRLSDHIVDLKII